MGGAEATLDKARGAFELGDYRWVAEVVNHVVFADPNNAAARGLQADALEQLGYQTESGPWRNFYLSAAQELRNGVRALPTPNSATPDTVRAMSVTLFFDYLAVRLNGARAGDRRITLACVFPDLDETWTLLLSHGALSHRRGNVPDADATITIGRSDLNDVILGTATVTALVKDDRAKLAGTSRRYTTWSTCSTSSSSGSTSQRPRHFHDPAASPGVRKSGPSRGRRKP
jgi:alkyl sulfatase BDS1-like metallo-beta-lactamase superfamily hydrolase